MTVTFLVLSCTNLKFFCIFSVFLGKPVFDPNTSTETGNQPTNLLVTFLEYSSIVIQDTKGKTIEVILNAEICCQKV